MAVVELNRYNQARTAPKATVRFYEDGRIIFNVAAVEVMELKPGEKILFLYETEMPGLAFLVKQTRGFPITIIEQKTRPRMITYSMPTCAALKKHFNMALQRFTCLLQADRVPFNGSMCWCIKLEPLKQ